MKTSLNCNRKNIHFKYYDDISDFNTKNINFKYLAAKNAVRKIFLQKSIPKLQPLLSIELKSLGTR